MASEATNEVKNHGCAANMQRRQERSPFCDHDPSSSIFSLLTLSALAVFWPSHNAITLACTRFKVLLTPPISHPSL